ncbi:MAG: hypothetical protein ACYTGZ_10820 [Planctomycetota bacterium]|jgi:hypothetical protein
MSKKVVIILVVLLVVLFLVGVGVGAFGKDDNTNEDNFDPDDFPALKSFGSILSPPGDPHTVRKSDVKNATLNGRKLTIAKETEATVRIPSSKADTRNLRLFLKSGPALTVDYEPEDAEENDKDETLKPNDELKLVFFKEGGTLTLNNKSKSGPCVVILNKKD